MVRLLRFDSLIIKICLYYNNKKSYCMQQSKEVTEKPLSVLKPNAVNALAPMFLRNLFYFLIVSSIFYGFYWVIRFFSDLEFSIRQIILASLILSLLIVFLPLLIRIIILYNTSYYFYKTYLMKEFELFIIRTKSAPYSQIVNITSDISIWDRITNCGDVILHTAEDKTPDIVLSYIENPEKIEKNLYILISKQKTHHN